MENWKDRLLEESFIYQGKEVGVIETITFDYDKLLDFISQELDKAREEGRREALKNLLERAERFGKNTSPRILFLMCDKESYDYAWEDFINNIKRELSKLKDNK